MALAAGTNNSTASSISSATNLALKPKCIGIEYDPIRTARLALLQYKDGEKRYIIAPNGLKVGAKLMSGATAPPEVGQLPAAQVSAGRLADS